MKKLLVLFLLLSGCYRTEFSEVISEKAKVLSREFIPSSTIAYFGPTMDMNGDIVVVLKTEHIPEKFLVNFECKHGKFTVNRRLVYDRVKDGEEVNIIYREKYRVTDELRELVDLDFIDAQKEIIAEGK